MKTAELTGAALDWVVSAIVENSRPFPIWIDGKPQSYAAYSTDWAQGGPIIEREEMTVCCHWMRPSATKLVKETRTVIQQTGDTPLIAAMRCYVASKLGDDIELPEELK